MVSKERFIKMYANLPAHERAQIIAIIDEKPYSWSVAYNEIFNDTILGQKILKFLDEVELS